MLKSSFSRKTWIAWVTLLIGLVVTVFASLQVKRGIDQERTRQFAFVCEQVTLKIQDRLDAYALILRAAVALFAASKEVERKEWQAFVGKLQVWQSVPGAQGIGFSQVIPADRLAAHIAQIHSEGFPGYTVYPSGKRPLYTSIIYLEPFRDSNLHAFGYDMYTEPVRLAAMEQARDTGEVALSGKVKLVKETETEAQAGTLMYAPVYRNGATVDTVEQRRAALLGWVYNPYRMNDLMAGILGKWESSEGKTVDLEIYDGREATPANLLFDSQPAHLANVDSPFHLQRTVSFNGRQWLLAFDRTSKASAMDYASAWSAAAGGFALSGMLFGLMLSIINTRNYAVRIADKLTDVCRGREAALQESKDQTRLLLDSTAGAIYGIDEDTTECQRAQDELARRESEMRTTLYSIADAVISLDANGCVLLMNPVAEQLTGWSESEAHGKLIEEVFCIIDDETRAKIDSPATSILHNGEKAGMASHALLIAHDGTERSIGASVAPIFGQDNTITGVVLVFRDLTKERESANIISQQLAIIESYVGLVALADLDGKLIYINAGGAKMLGVNHANELKNKIITDFIAPTNFGSATDKLISDAINGKQWNGESMLKRIDGISIPVSHTLFPICDADGIPRHIGMIMMDISTQKKLQEKLLLSEKLAVMGRLVADVSHELNNPLAIVIGRTELILSHLDEQSAPFKAKLETVLKSARRCKTILSNLLTYSKTIGKPEGTINLPDLIGEAVEAVNYQYDMSAIEVVVNCTLPEDIGIIGNKDALLSVFINIIRNAVRAMVKKGALTFFVAKGGEGHLSIEIHDTGIGISKEKLTEIFQPFSSGWDDGDGTGLGLATSLGIIETHGGIMWVESEGIGKGSTFMILLPYKKLIQEEVEKDQAINKMEA